MKGPEPLFGGLVLVQDLYRTLKQLGYSDSEIARRSGYSMEKVRSTRDGRTRMTLNMYIDVASILHWDVLVYKPHNRTGASGVSKDRAGATWNWKDHAASFNGGRVAVERRSS